MTEKLTLFMMIVAAYGMSYAGELKAGQKYKVIKPIYLMGVYDSLNHRTISSSTARAYLNAEKYYKKSFVVFQTEVPLGTVMTIIGPAPKPWYSFFQGDKYFIKLEPDLSQGLEIEIQLDRGIEGKLDGLNPELFSRM